MLRSDNRFHSSRFPNMKKSLLAILLCSAIAAPVMAASAVPTDGITVNLRGEASVTIPNDEAVLNFTKRSQKQTAALAADEVILAANKAIEALKKFGDKVIVETTSLSTSPVYSKARDGEVSVPGAWRSRETLSISVKDVRLVSEVLSAAAKTMEYDGMHFRISKDARRSKNEALIRAAMQNAMAQATTVAEELGCTDKNVKVTGVTVGDRAEHAVRYRAEAAVMSARMMDNGVGAAPQVSAGTTDVSLSVHLTAKIMP